MKTPDTKIGNDQFFDMGNIDEMSRWTGWFKIEFLHSLLLQPTLVGRLSSAFAVDTAGPAWLSSGR